MNLYQSTAAALAVLGLAGCASSPAWEKPRPRQRIVEVKPAEVPKETPKETPKEVPKETPKPEPKYVRIPLAVIYEAEDNKTADIIRGYAALTGKHPVKEAYAADKDKNGVASFDEISDKLEVYRKDHGGEIKLQLIKGGRVLTYSTFVNLPTDGVKELKARYEKEKPYERMELLDNWEKMFGDLKEEKK